MFSILPMYDLPRLRSATDAFWREIFLACQAAGIDAPEHLSRRTDLTKAWQQPDLFLAQACGLPYVNQLRGKVHLLGTPIYDLPECGQGTYASIIIVPKSSRQNTLNDFADATPPRIAINGFNSQSGYAALIHNWLAVDLPRPAKSQFQITGGHVNSIAAIAENRADIAAIDCISWALIKQGDPNCTKVKVIAVTDQVPGLPLITAQPSLVPALSKILEQTMGAQPSNSTNMLKIKGLKKVSDSDYEIVKTRFDALPKF